MRGWMLAGVMIAAVLTGQAPPDAQAAQESVERPDAPASLDEAMQRAERQREERKAHALQAVASGDPMHALLAIDQVRDVLPQDAELQEAMETLRGPAVEAALKRAWRVGESGKPHEAVEILAPIYVATKDERVGAALKEARFWAGVGHAAREERGERRREENVVRGADEGELRRVMGEVERVMARLERLEEKFTFTGRAEPAVDELRRALEEMRRDVDRVSVELRREVDSLSREVMSVRRELDRQPR